MLLNKWVTNSTSMVKSLRPLLFQRTATMGLSHPQHLAIASVTPAMGFFTVPR